MEPLDLAPLVQPAPNWRIEDGSENPPQQDAEILHHAPLIENQEADTLWYSQYFINKEHQNYLGIDENAGPYALSILREDNQIRAILWRGEGPAPICFKVKPKETLSASDVLKMIDPNISKKKLREVKSMSIQDELFKLEEKTAIRTRFYKFGVVYTRAGQKKEGEMFGNRLGSDEFNRFLNILGDRIALKNWEGFNAGLDTRFDRTGKYSIYTNYMGYEVMYHVSTLLPHTEGDPQQVDRKRHIGNDVVIIIYQEHDSKEQFNPLAISARFPHLYAIVRPVDAQASAYRLSFAIKDVLKPFGPPLPNPHIFDDLNNLKQFLLVKLINGEREAIRSAPDFRTSDALLSFLRDIHEKFPKSLGSRQTSKTDLKEEVRDLPYEAPASPTGPLIQRSSSPSMMAFQTKNICTLQFEITCADTWGNLMVVGTTSGLFVFDPMRPAGDQWYRVNTHSSDKYSAYKRLDVIDSCGILLALMPKVGIVIYDLGSLFDEGGPNELKLEKTKQATLYSLSDNLTLCVAVKSELLLFRWEEDRFIPNHALQMSQPPRSIMFWRHQLVVGIDVGFELIHPDPENAVSQLLFASPSKESRPLDAVVLNDELLLCFTNVGIFVNIDGIKTRSFDVKWNTVPTSFVYIYPYLLVFSPISIEVRTLVNGNMVQSISPDDGMQNFHVLTTSQGIFYSSRADTGSHSTIHQLKLGAPLAAAKKAAARRAGSSAHLLASPPSPGNPPAPYFRASSMPGIIPPARNMMLPVATDPSPFNIRSMENSEDAAEDGTRPSPRSSSSASASRSSSPRDADRIQRVSDANQVSKLSLHHRATSDTLSPPVSTRQTMSDSNTPRAEDGRTSARGRRRPRPVSVGFTTDQTISPRDDESPSPVPSKKTTKKRSKLRSSTGLADSNDSSESGAHPVGFDGSDERSASPSEPTRKVKPAKAAKSPKSPRGNNKPSLSLEAAIAVAQEQQAASPRKRSDASPRSPKRANSTIVSPRSGASPSSKRAGDAAEVPSTTPSTELSPTKLSRKKSKMLNSQDGSAAGPPEKKDA